MHMDTNLTFVDDDMEWREGRRGATNSRVEEKVAVGLVLCCRW
jgi:hypothetical protein